MARWSVPFCSTDGRQEGLWYLAAGYRDTTHLELYPLPSYSPQLQVIERFWKVLRRRATHNRLFQTVAQLKRTLRNNLCRSIYSSL